MIITEQNIEQIITIAIQAGEKILEYYKKDINVEIKEDKTPVTIADKEASKLITTALQKAFPEIPFISEEENIPEYETRKNWEYYWLIDPLDGTKEFINQTDEFTVNIALVKNNKIYFGLIYHPIRKLTYYALENQGAYKISGSKKIKLSKTDSLTNNMPLIVAGSRSYSSQTFNTYIESLNGNFSKITIQRLGSSYKFCLAAESSIHLYPRFGPTSEWDTAAAHIICNEVGLVILQPGSDQELEYNKESLLNPHFLVCNKDSLDLLNWLKTPS
ncbi:MAG: 3'(2'),5'-bisphosphate nucleotidase [Planctomycetota bacterium]|nr:MAG: 3'(2'),5'-bisphosphate nucleotidase [Planctomycetota bacterium]